LIINQKQIREYEAATKEKYLRILALGLYVFAAIELGCYFWKKKKGGG